MMLRRPFSPLLLRPLGLRPVAARLAPRPSTPWPVIPALAVRQRPRPLPAWGVLARGSNSTRSYSYLPHRPTKEELLAATSGFWRRLKVRFKWVSIRSMRPWNVDEWGAFVSWFMLGHIVWVLVGTTTFMSLVILSINTVFAQETLAKWVGDYLTRSAGLTIVFESAIVPTWSDGVISFRNVFVSRRPGRLTSSVSKGSSTNAAAVAAAERHSDASVTVAKEDDGNYTQFDLTLATVNVTLSLLKWWNGKGLLQDVEIKGVRGVVDRTSVHSSPDDNPDPYSYRHRHQPGDFEIEAFKLEDLQVLVYQPNGFRPFPVSIFSCELPRFRKRWLFYDLLSAHHMSGSFDGSLFTIHPRQIYPSSFPSQSFSHFSPTPTSSSIPLLSSSPSSPLHPSPHSSFSPPLHTTVLHPSGAAVGEVSGGSFSVQPPGGPLQKLSRLRIDGLRIDHLNRGVEGPFGWIFEGNVDIVADVLLPTPVDDGLSKVMSNVFDQLEDIVTANRSRLLQYTSSSSFASSSSPPPSNRHLHHHHPLPARQDTTTAVAKHDGDDDDDNGDGAGGYLIMDLRVHLNAVRAAVPLFPRNISYVNQALVRPIVAYINAKNTYIPMSCRLVKRLSDFDGSWTVYDCGLMADLSAQAYEAFARDVVDQQSRVRRLRKVGFWTLSMAVQAIFMGLAGNVL